MSFSHYQYHTDPYTGRVISVPMFHTSVYQVVQQGRGGGGLDPFRAREAIQETAEKLNDIWDKPYFSEASNSNSDEDNGSSKYGGRLSQADKKGKRFLFRL